MLTTKSRLAIFKEITGNSNLVFIVDFLEGHEEDFQHLNLETALHLQIEPIKELELGLDGKYYTIFKKPLKSNLKIISNNNFIFNSGAYSLEGNISDDELKVLGFTNLKEIIKSSFSFSCTVLLVCKNSYLYPDTAFLLFIISDVIYE